MGLKTPSLIIRLDNVLLSNSTCKLSYILVLLKRSTSNQWRLVTVIRGGAATSTNKNFIKTENITFVSAVWTAMMHDISLSTNQLCDFCILICCSAVQCYGMNDW